MNREDAREKTLKMRNSVLTDARTKAKDIELKATDEFNLEKHKIMGKEKEKIRAEFARKVKQVETRRAIASSAAINQSRLEKIRAQSEAFASVSETAKKQLGAQVGSQTFLEQLIVQGLLIILEEDVVVRCREEDVTAVRACLNTAAELYSKTIETQTGARRTCRLTLDTKHLSANLVGGVTLSCQGGTIVVDNTIDSRLNLIMEQDVPAVRSLLFPIKG